MPKSAASLGQFLDVFFGLLSAQLRPFFLLPLLPGRLEMVVAETSPLLQGKEQLMPKDNRARRSPFPQCLGHFHW